MRVFRPIDQNSVYLPFRVPREHLAQFLKDCPDLGIHGLSVKIPHKEAVLEFCTKVDRAVQGIGVANTLILQGDQVLGYNTEYRAALDSLASVLRLSHGEKPLAGHSALLLGAGGVARAIAFGLVQRGAQVTVASRRSLPAQAFQKQIGCRVIDWDSRHSVNADVLVNCTPVGMHPNVDETPFDRHHLRPSMTVFDTVYNPEQTLLIKEARRQNCVVVTGVDMFVRQASLQFQYFTGKPAPVDLMREELKRTIGPVRYSGGTISRGFGKRQRILPTTGNVTSSDHDRKSAARIRRLGFSGGSGEPRYLRVGLAPEADQSLVAVF